MKHFAILTDIKAALYTENFIFTIGLIKNATIKNLIEMGSWDLVTFFRVNNTPIHKYKCCYLVQVECLDTGSCFSVVDD